MVAPLVIGAGISAAGSLLGGILGDRAANQRNQQSMEFAREQMAMQREFAQSGIRWRVADAKAAGVHPLYALGAQTHSPSPVSVMQESSPMPDALASMGQSIGRAVEATQTAPERARDHMYQLTRERAELENQLLGAQIALTRSQIGPAFPGSVPNPDVIPSTAGPAFGNRVQVRPVEPRATNPGNPAQEAFEVPDFGLARTPTGLAIVPSSDVKERIEDQFIPENMWAWRNSLVPNFNPDNHAPDPRLYPTKPGHRWRWSYTAQEFRQVPVGGGASGTWSAPRRSHKMDQYNRGYVHP